MFVNNVFFRSRVPRPEWMSLPYNVVFWWPVTTVPRLTNSSLNKSTLWVEYQLLLSIVLPLLLICLHCSFVYFKFRSCWLGDRKRSQPQQFPLAVFELPAEWGLNPWLSPIPNTLSDPSWRKICITILNGLPRTKTFNAPAILPQFRFRRAG